MDACFYFCNRLLVFGTLFFIIHLTISRISIVTSPLWLMNFGFACMDFLRKNVFIEFHIGVDKLFKSHANGT